jgi:hypothetical protein
MRFLLLVGVLWLGLGLGGYVYYEVGLGAIRERNHYSCLLYGQTMLHIDGNRHFLRYQFQERIEYSGNTSPYPYSKPIFSPDQSRFFAMDNRTGEAFIEVMATGERYPVYQETGFWHRAAWEPSGRGLVYARQIDDSQAYWGNVTRQVFMFSPQGDLIHEVTFAESMMFDYNLDPFSIDAHPGMLFLTDHWSGQFYLAPWEGGEVKMYEWPPFAPSQAINLKFWSWSPDYAHVAFFIADDLLITDLATGEHWTFESIMPPPRPGEEYGLIRSELIWASERDLIVFFYQVFHVDEVVPTFIRFTLEPAGWQLQSPPTEPPNLIRGANSPDGRHWDYLADPTLREPYPPYTAELRRLDLATGQMTTILPQGEVILLEEWVFFFQERGDDWGYYHFRLGEEPGEWHSLAQYYLLGRLPSQKQYYYSPNIGPLHLRLHYPDRLQDFLFTADGEQVFNSDDPQWDSDYIYKTLTAKTSKGHIWVYDPQYQVFYDLGPPANGNGNTSREAQFMPDVGYPRLFLISKSDAQTTDLYTVLEPRAPPRFIAELSRGEFSGYAFSPDRRHLAWLERPMMTTQQIVMARVYNFETGQQYELGALSLPIYQEAPTWTRCGPTPLP